MTRAHFLARNGAPVIETTLGASAPTEVLDLK